MKEWKPAIDFKKADFWYNEKNQTSERKDQIKSDHSQKKVKKWIPPTITSLNTTSQKSKNNFQRVIPVPQKKQEIEPIAVQKSSQDMTRMYINNTIVSHPILTIDILRKWYWEKNPASYKKIFIILRSLSKEHLIHLLHYFTEIEKKQFIEIYKKNIKPDRSEILSARQEFIHFIKELS